MLTAQPATRFRGPPRTQVPAPSYSVLRARLDVLDTQLDLAQAVQSSLALYDEQGEGSSDDDWKVGYAQKQCSILSYHDGVSFQGCWG